MRNKNEIAALTEKSKRITFPGPRDNFDGFTREVWSIIVDSLNNLTHGHRITLEWLDYEAEWCIEVILAASYFDRAKYDIPRMEVTRTANISKDSTVADMVTLTQGLVDLVNDDIDLMTKAYINKENRHG